MNGLFVAQTEITAARARAAGRTMEVSTKSKGAEFEGKRCARQEAESADSVEEAKAF